MTNTELKKIIYKACEQIAVEEAALGCVAIDNAQGLDWLASDGFSPLAKSYAGFYDFKKGDMVEDYLDLEDITDEFTQPMRQTMLLNFLEYSRLHDDLR